MLERVLSVCHHRHLILPLFSVLRTNPRHDHDLHITSLIAIPHFAVLIGSEFPPSLYGKRQCTGSTSFATGVAMANGSVEPLLQVMTIDDFHLGRTHSLQPGAEYIRSVAVTGNFWKPWPLVHVLCSMDNYKP